VVVTPPLRSADAQALVTSKPVHIDPHRAVLAGRSNVKTMHTTQVVYAPRAAGAVDRDEQVCTLDAERKRLSYELLHAAECNCVEKIKELLDRGANIDQIDYDTENTAIIMAAARGHKHAVYYLLERGAAVNAQNHRGETALHEAVKFKFNELAIRLVAAGADPDLENCHGHSPYDLALPWLQKELRDERDRLLKRAPAPALLKSIQQKSTPNYDSKFGQPIAHTIVRNDDGYVVKQTAPQPPTAIVAAATGPAQIVISVCFRAGGTVSLFAAASVTVSELLMEIATRLQIPRLAHVLDLIEIAADRQERQMSRDELPAKIIVRSGSRLQVHPKRGCSDVVMMQFRDAAIAHRKL